MTRGNSRIPITSDEYELRQIVNTFAGDESFPIDILAAFAAFSDELIDADTLSMDQLKRYCICVFDKSIITEESYNKIYHLEGGEDSNTYRSILGATYSDGYGGNGLSVDMFLLNLCQDLQNDQGVLYGIIPAQLLYKSSIDVASQRKLLIEHNLVDSIIYGYA